MLRAYCAFAISGASSETSVAAAVRCFLRSQPTSHSSHSLSFGKWTVLGHLKKCSMRRHVHVAVFRCSFRSRIC